MPQEIQVVVGFDAEESIIPRALRHRLIDPENEGPAQVMAGRYIVNGGTAEAVDRALTALREMGVQLRGPLAIETEVLRQVGGTDGFSAPERPTSYKPVVFKDHRRILRRRGIISD
jgi:hypothetical protein